MSKSVEVGLIALLSVLIWVCQGAWLVQVAQRGIEKDCREMGQTRIRGAVITCSVKEPT